jgi:hypothetical protein
LGFESLRPLFPPVDLFSGANTNGAVTNGRAEYSRHFVCDADAQTFTVLHLKITPAAR